MQKINLQIPYVSKEECETIQECEKYLKKEYARADFLRIVVFRAIIGTG
ncbi:MAG: hypothetical protein FIO02_06810 [Nitrosopumilales archaeon]|nr:hypothetical protein [Nitrosopumilales archaeon]